VNEADIERLHVEINPMVPGRLMEQIDAFATNYTNLKFAADSVDAILSRRGEFPLWLKEEDHEWMMRYWMLQCGAQDDIVFKACTLRHKKMKVPREIIEAMLMDVNSTLEDISMLTGWGVPILDAYEHLFFNVRDRMADRLFLANVVYPGYKIEETFKGYLETTDFSRILMRAGYNNGIQDVAELAGIKSDMMHKLSSGDAPFKLEDTIMATGYIYARNGWLHSDKSELMRSSRMLLTAAKAGGVEDKETDPFQSLSQAMLGEIRRAKGGEAREAVKVQTELYDELLPTVTVSDKHKMSGGS